MHRERVTAGSLSRVASGSFRIGCFQRQVVRVKMLQMVCVVCHHRARAIGAWFGPYRTTY
jgi:S-adenosylmethionine:diacylglycerol 3-amino-3-carboxypropyl transferase